jgi:hypothetical protein
MPLSPGDRLGPYEIVAPLGAGGMGEVYRARDTRLGRDVAVKVSKERFSERFEKEARVIASLNHPNICTLHDVGPNYLVMELVEGPTLADRIKDGPLPLGEVLGGARQIAGALEAAHESGIVHRDLKPGNIKLKSDGTVKVLDFGLAKRSGHAAPELPESTLTMDPETRAGQIIGTIGYMSPEQAEGKAVGEASDIFSLGVVLYEMLSGQRPFRGDTKLATLAAVLRETPEPPHRFRHEVPEELERIVLRCLEKKPDARYASAGELRRELDALQGRLVPKPWKFTLKGPASVAAMLAMLLALGGFGAWLYTRASRARWAEREALPEVSRLLDKGQPLAALRLERQAERYASPRSPQLSQAKARLSMARLSVQTTPAGADIYVDDYAGDAPRWELLGRSPLEARLVQAGYYRLRVVKDGFAPVEWARRTPLNSTVQIPLRASPDVPPGMVWIPGGPDAYPAVAPVPVSEFWLDKFEVTNREFKAFLDARGYEATRVLEGGVHQGRRSPLLGPSHDLIPRRDRTAGTGHVGIGDLPGRKG